MIQRELQLIYSKTLTDLAFTSKAELIIGSGVIHLGISDHSLIYIQRKISVPRKEPIVIKSRNFKHYNSNNFKSDTFPHTYMIKYSVIQCLIQILCGKIGKQYFCQLQIFMQKEQKS